MPKRICAIVIAAIMLATLPAPALAKNRDTAVIDSIEILGFTAPSWNAHPCYDVYAPEGAHYYIDWSTWYYYKPGDAGRMYETDLFNDPDMFYYQEFEIWPEEGYTFADDAAVSINGENSLVDSGQWSFGNSYYLVWTVDFSVAPPAGIAGDADLNGVLDISDALLALRFSMGLVGLSPDAQALCDTDGSGDVGVNDALTILRLAMGLVGGL